MNEYEYIFKLILIGDVDVGKTCLLLRFVDDTFTVSNKRIELGIKFKSKTVSVDDTSVRLELYDTEKGAKLEPKFYGGVHGIMLVYDITEEDSFDNLKRWLEEIKKYASKNVNKLLVGNKSDLVRQRFVEYGTAKEFADELRLSFFEVSAKNSNNVEEAFMTLATEIKKRIESEGPEAMALAADGGHKDEEPEEPNDKGPICSVS